jgi:predicted nucleic acid-binding protein
VPLALALAEEIGTDLPTNDYKLAAAPNLQEGLNVLMSPVRS